MNDSGIIEEEDSKLSEHNRSKFSRSNESKQPAKPKLTKFLTSVSLTADMYEETEKPVEKEKDKKAPRSYVSHYYNSI